MPAKQSRPHLTKTQQAYLARLRPLAQAVGLDARFAASGLLEGFMEVFNPRTNESLAAGINVDVWLQGYSQAHEQFISLATTARDFLAVYQSGATSPDDLSREHDLRAAVDAILPRSHAIAPEL